MTANPPTKSARTPLLVWLALAILNTIVWWLWIDAPRGEGDGLALLFTALALVQTIAALVALVQSIRARNTAHGVLSGLATLSTIGGFIVGGIWGLLTHASSLVGGWK